MPLPQNMHVYERVGVSLHYQGTFLAAFPVEAAKQAAEGPGKFVVTDADFTVIYKVNVRLTASAD